MEEFVKLAGTLVAVFFLVSLATETILESFRGCFALFGIEVLKSKQSLEDALNEVAEFLPADQKNAARFEALVTIVRKAESTATDVQNKLTKLKAELENAVDPSGKLKIVDREKERLAALAAPIRKKIEASEAKRVFALRIISAVIGIFVSAAAGINVIELVGAGGGQGWREALSYVIAGLAAAGGSSFWHDQLDRVRSLKQAGESVASLTASVRKG